MSEPKKQKVRYPWFIVRKPIYDEVAFPPDVAVDMLEAAFEQEQWALHGEMKQMTELEFDEGEG